MKQWDAQVEQACHDAIARLCSARSQSDEQRAAWHRLLQWVAPFIEGWAARSWLLRRWRLATEDDQRAVLVLVLSRLSRDRYDNLRRYLARQAPETSLSDEHRAIERLARLARIDADESAMERAPDTAATPLRSWLLTLVRFCTCDHVRQRMGWSQQEGPSRRDLGTDAARLSAVAEPAARPPMTDYLTVRGLLQRIDEQIDTFDPEMRQALQLWTRDASYADIAAALGLDDGARARKLVRAALARLRDRFRADWSGFLD